MASQKFYKKYFLSSEDYVGNTNSDSRKFSHDSQVKDTVILFYIGNSVRYSLLRLEWSTHPFHHFLLVDRAAL